MDELQDELLLACSVQRHGFNNWEMVAIEFSDAVFHHRRCIQDLSPLECQDKYQELQQRFLSLYQMDHNEDQEDDESVFVKFMVDKLTQTYIAALREDVKLRDASIQKKFLLLCKLEAEDRIESREEDGDKFNRLEDIERKYPNINKDLTKILDELRSHKHCCLFESRLRSQENKVYTKQIRKHMDLQIVQNKLEQAVYSDLKIAFFRDLLLIFNNAIVYYPKETLQHLAALELRDIVVREMSNYKPSSHRDVVCGLAADGNTILVKGTHDKRTHNRKNTAQERESSIRRSARLKGRDYSEMKKDDPDYEYYDRKGQRRSRRTRKP